MIANVSAHRRANAFAQALEERSARDAAAERPEETAEGPEEGALLALADGLAALPRPTLDPQVKVEQRTRLMAAMEAMALDGADAADPSVPEQRSPGSAKGSHRAAGPLRKLRPRTRLTKGLAAGGLTVSVAAGAFGGVAAASSHALPGDSLYGLKRGMEDVKLGLADGDTDRGGIYLDQASTRLSEVRRLMERQRSGPLDHESLAEIRRTLSGMRHDASEGHRLLYGAYRRDGSLGPIQTLSAFTDNHRATWSDLRDRLPAQLGDVSSEVSDVFDAIDDEVAPLRSLLPGPPSKEASDSGAPGTGDTSPGTSHPARGATPSESGAPSTGHGRGDGKPSPSHSGDEGGPLFGDGSGLLDPPDSGTATTPSDGGSGLPKPDITLPPLLPGLIPGLGIDESDDSH
ncbi:DUF5667 domain-containing protein [Streptomyces sp. NPDC050560]|uniref:DUF5667 domain-containing protein n=1 Tax=Streptomyces sp. NPDC050560 TaxID=3365630 RepID=UPI0037A53487